VVGIELIGVIGRIDLQELRTIRFGAV